MVKQVWGEHAIIGKTIENFRRAVGVSPPMRWGKAQRELTKVLAHRWANLLRHSAFHDSAGVVLAPTLAKCQNHVDFASTHESYTYSVPAVYSSADLPASSDYPS